MENNNSLNDVTDKELERFGFVPIPNHDEFDNLYFVHHGGSSTKMYFEKTEYGFNLRGFRLRKEKEIRTFEELIQCLEDIKTL